MSKRSLAWLSLPILLLPTLTLVQEEISAPLAALQKFTEMSAVPGYESALAGEIQKRLKSLKLDSKTDNLGNVIVTLGSGEPTRVMAAPIDEVGYVVSGITEDGFLRVQRLPQGQQFGFFDTLLTAQPVSVLTKAGKALSGVVAARSVHLMTARGSNPTPVRELDDIYIDIGAQSAKEAGAAGVDLLDPITIEKHFYKLGGGMVTAPSLGDRFGAVALLEMLGRMDATSRSVGSGAKLKGTLNVAFVTQQWAGGRGLDRLAQEVQANDWIIVGRLQPPRPGEKMAEPPSGVLIAIADPSKPSPLAGELSRLAAERNIPARGEPAAALPRVSYTGGPQFPPRFAHLGIAVRFPLSPAEMIDMSDLEALVGLLVAYAQQ